MHTRTHAHSAHMHAPVCLLVPPVLPQSALKHAPRPRLPGQPEAKVPDGDWGEGAKGEECCPSTPPGGMVALSGSLMGDAARWPCFLPPWCFRWSSTSRENSLSRGGGFGTPSEGLPFAERWGTYLEWKTEVEEVSTVTWPWTLAPLPHLGAYLQTAIGSALTVSFVGSETRPRGKQREFVLKRKACGCFLLMRIGTESLRGRTGGEREPYLNSAFGNAKLSGQSFPGRYPRVGVLLKERLQGVLLA